MTESEIHLILASGKLFCDIEGAFLSVESIQGLSTIAGALLSLYMSLGVPAQNLITASIMSIPSSMAISKIRMPEVEEPVTRGRVVVDLGDDPKDAPASSALQAFGKGAVLGLFICGQILCNVITILAFIGTINGLLTWIGRGFGIHQLTLQLGVRYVFYPLAFLTGMSALLLLIPSRPPCTIPLYVSSLILSTGVPRAEIMRVAELLATKLIENEIVAYSELQVMMASSDPLSKRGYTIASYALCSFANLTSLSIQIGVLSALAPSRTRVISRVGPSAIDLRLHVNATGCWHRVRILLYLPFLPSRLVRGR
jgi:CNT family concentrative nucleoside transporter